MSSLRYGLIRMRSAMIRSHESTIAKFRPLAICHVISQSWRLTGDENERATRVNIFITAVGNILRSSHSYLAVWCARLPDYGGAVSSTSVEDTAVSLLSQCLCEGGEWRCLRLKRRRCVGRFHCRGLCRGIRRTPFSGRICRSRARNHCRLQRYII